MKIKDRLLFLKYALPCAGTLVQRGKISQKSINTAIKQVASDRSPKRNIEKIFKVANKECARIAKKMHKESIDSEVIRRYFLFEHDKVITERFKLMRDFNPSECRVYSGRIIKTGGKLAVLVHYYYIVEKYPNLKNPKKKGR